VFGLKVEKKLPLPPGYIGERGEDEYLQAEQCILSGCAAVINRESQIRDGVCGTPILHQGSSLVDQLALHRGEVVGFMHDTDVVGCDHDSPMYSYCPLVDFLIVSGWDIYEKRAVFMGKGVTLLRTRIDWENITVSEQICEMCIRCSEKYNTNFWKGVSIYVLAFVQEGYDKRAESIWVNRRRRIYVSSLPYMQ
jgi:hypothetical protein